MLHCETLGKYLAGNVRGHRLSMLATTVPFEEMSKLLKGLASALGDENPDSILDFLKRAKHHRNSLPLPSPPENS